MKIPHLSKEQKLGAGLLAGAFVALVATLALTGGAPHARAISTTTTQPVVTTTTVAPATTAPSVTTTTVAPVTTTTQPYHPPVTTTTLYHPPVTTTTAPSHPAYWTGTQPPSALGYDHVTIVAYGWRVCDPHGPTFTAYFTYDNGYTYLLSGTVIPATGQYLFFDDQDGHPIPNAQTQYMAKLYSTTPGDSVGCFIGSTQVG
jgi:hypothetical protein